jgi:hypothetical protein
VQPAPAGPRSAPATALDVYGGRGSWLDIFAGSTWSRPAAVVAALRSHGVDTLYLQTGNYDQRDDIVRPRVLGEWLRAGHAAGLQVVSWYLPSFADPRTDGRRALAAIRFRSSDGDRFDGFALDIEAGLVHPVALRNRRLLALARLLRSDAPPNYPLAAIIPSPVGMDRHPHYWPGFPYRPLANVFDAFMPMAYFSYYVHTPAGAYSYTRRVVTLLRARIADPGVVIHVIGGVANRLNAATVAGFVRAADDCAVDGLSLYAFPQTSVAQWAALTAATLTPSDTGPLCG